VRRGIIPGTRGAIVRAYVAFLTAAARLGRPRSLDATPAEYAAALGPLGGLAHLTDLFMDARYGPDDPRPESVAAAQGAADEAIRKMEAAFAKRMRRSRS
jgi:hypothetical protein